MRKSFPAWPPFYSVHLVTGRECDAHGIDAAILDRPGEWRRIWYCTGYGQGTSRQVDMLT